MTPSTAVSTTALQPRIAFAQRSFNPFALGEIVDDPDENRSLFLLGFADRQVHGEGRAVLALTQYLAADADDFAFAGPAEIVDVAIMFFAIRPGHQHLDVLADDLVGAIFEQLFRRPD